MTRDDDKDSPLSAFRGVKRKTVRLSPAELVTTGYLDDRRLPLVMWPREGGIDLSEWAGSNRAYLERELEKHGAILFRGFNLKSAPAFERFVRAVSGEVLEYNERSSPRSQISGRIYTSTDYPPDKQIFLHNEQSYNLVFPMK